MRRGSISTFDPFLLETKVKVRMRKRITAHAHLKRGRISREIQKSIARAAWRFLRKKRYHAILRYAENRSIPFSRRFARVTLTHVTGPLKSRLSMDFQPSADSFGIRGLGFKCSWWHPRQANDAVASEPSIFSENHDYESFFPCR